ncbi:MAG TPA: HD domain-containing phosphohydrolase, partial [Telmatospirillum sp.]|nr:HD domain-containing phosphohydrolase [Telmatospirillum sp.]
LAAPMHDLGKIGISDALLNKPGAFTPEERAIMCQHAAMGHDLLKKAQQPALRAAAVIALQHHEWWNGAGYPQGLAGENIHIFGAVTALADVFDALAHPRCYKPAWPMDRVIDHIRSNRGKQFSPRLVDAFLAHVDDFVAIQDANPD